MRLNKLLAAVLAELFAEGALLGLGAALKLGAGAAVAVGAKPGAAGVLPGAAMSRHWLSPNLPMNWRQSPKGRLVFPPIG